MGAWGGEMSNQAHSVYLEAREIADPEKRKAYLDRTCVNSPELRQRVERMLADEARAEAFFTGEDPSQVAADKTAIVPPPQPVRTEDGLEGRTIGRYKLLQKLGEGGFGSVWMAEQTEPVRRKVALKIIKRGMDSCQVIARFEAERQALAMMDHPNIAKVLDAGTTDTGRPYFVMELVKGIPVIDFCNQWKLETEQRLLLFSEICSAINHAHQKGIIHRDIKPSNVLVTLHGDRPVPMVIDFGIAKATEVKLTDKTLFTRYDQFIGTPAYMSPEQVGLSGLDIDTRSDIYSLGVLLYELLAGCPPFDPKTLISAGFDEMRRIIREVDPPQPSLRVSTAAREESQRIQEQLGASTQRLGRLLKGELDWIVMKALEKDRSRRYESANALADDISRYLSNEPVLAAAPSAAYLFRKFAKRNKAAIGVAAMITAVLLIASTVSTWQAVRATRAEQRISGLLAESKSRQAELAETVALLTESTEELASHMRRFLIGKWEMHMRFDEESMKKNMKDHELALFKSMYGALAGDMSSQLEFREDGSATGETVAPTLIQAMAPLMDKKRITDGQWDLTKLQGKRTTVKISSRGLAGIRQSEEFTITVVNSSTLLMEISEFENSKVQPIITFKRIP